MELQDIEYKQSEYIETASGNKVCRRSVLCGSQNIMLMGKTIIQSNCIIRGDLANVKIGRHCLVSSRAVIRPPFKKFTKGYYKTLPFVSIVFQLFFNCFHFVQKSGVSPDDYRRQCLYRIRHNSKRGVNRFLRIYRQKLCYRKALRSERLLSYSRQYSVTAGDSSSRICCL